MQQASLVKLLLASLHSKPVDNELRMHWMLVLLKEFDRQTTFLVLLSLEGFSDFNEVQVILVFGMTSLYPL